MDSGTALLILKLVAEGRGVALAIKNLAQRAINGEVVTSEEIEAASNEVRKAVAGWDDVAGVEAAVKEGAKEVSGP